MRMTKPAHARSARVSFLAPPLAGQLDHGGWCGMAGTAASIAARRSFRRLAKRARISDFTVGNRHDTDTQAPALRRR